MVSIIQFLFNYIQLLHEYIYQLLFLLVRTNNFRQWRHEELHSPKYQKFKTDKLPIILEFHKQNYEFLISYYKHKYGQLLKPVKRHANSSVDPSINCPRCNAPHDYIYNNNGDKGQLLCKVCSERFNPNNHVTKPLKLLCPHCNHTLERVKSKKVFVIHKCRNLKCSYYLSAKKKVPKNISHTKLSRYKLHYIYREFIVDFFNVSLDSLPDNASGLKFRGQSAHIMGLCLTYYVNLKLSLRETSQAMKEIHNVSVSHTTIANYAKTAAVMIKPFTDRFDFEPSNSLSADETYIKIRGAKTYVWFIMDTIKKSLLGYTVSDNRTVGPCIIAMRDAFSKFNVFKQHKKLPDDLDFVADGYSAYPLAAQQFERNNPEHKFKIIQVIGLKNVDDVSTKYRPLKQMIERLNRTFKRSYKLTNGYDNLDSAYYGVALWVIYYNFLRPHKHKGWKNTLNTIPELEVADNMPGKWQLLIHLGQQTIIKLQDEKP